MTHNSEGHDEAAGEDLQPGKQRRAARSCDNCRQRKIKCDGSMDSACSSCLAFGSTCNFLQQPKKRGRKNGIPLVEQLRTQIFDLKAEVALLKSKLRSVSFCSLCSQPLQSVANINTAFPTPPGSSEDSSPTDVEEPFDDAVISDELNHRFGKCSMESINTTYLGPSSPFILAGNVVAMQEKHLGREVLTRPGRPLFWRLLPWEKEAYDKKPNYVFPANDLIDSLLGHYRSRIHPILPILHYPSFTRSVAEGLHLTDPDFGSTLLAALAVASRYSNDPRVFVDRDVSLSAGWMFARQIQITPKLFQPTIYEVQMYCLLTIFSLGTSVPQASWFYLGLGIRSLQQSGEHRRKRRGHMAKPDHELWKRVFWTLTVLERKLCFCMGRKPTLLSEDCDVEPIEEIDDEFWDRGFVQPLGKPSELSYFAYDLRLYDILEDVTRRLYGSQKSKKLFGWNGPNWEHQTVADFDSAMNDFLDTVPPHLRWDPENPDLQGTFFDQSATLYITYHYIRITIHRPYVQKSSVGPSAPSLSICANAARNIIRTADIWLSRLKQVPHPVLIDAVFIAGLILVLNVHVSRRKQSESPKEAAKDLAQVEKALDIFKFTESRLQPVGRIWELLRELWVHETPETAGSTSLTDSPPTLSNELVQPQPPCSHSWDGEWQQPSTFTPGMTIEELLAAADPFDAMTGVLHEEMMTTLMASSTDVVNMDDWDAYMEDRNFYGPEDQWAGVSIGQSQ
ncbi:fungal-trans domain-containing protein [Favolaschia claudopus]|uniref:Fungal-trans domain-containing protein n=1 Tax=Favolaschia claudopus TaxID=2862362 RepID=A0AAW0ABG7_9AGAR